MNLCIGDKFHWSNQWYYPSLCFIVVCCGRFGRGENDGTTGPEEAADAGGVWAEET